MAEFWPPDQTGSSWAKLVKPGSGSHLVPGSQPEGETAPTVLSALKAPSGHDIPSPAARDLAGEMLSHYRLDDYVGVGGMGAVFRATDMRLDRSVALKILPPEHAKDAEIVQRFQNEARAAARLDHENIARVYYVGEDRGLQFIAFEFVEGVNVRDLIQQCGPPPPHEVVNYAIQIAGALVHAFARGVVHRDIKPSNIIITLEGRAKLVDMGLARNFERRQEGILTQNGILGTFDYIAPEQARDPRSADFRSDIYSFGCTLYHMLTGRPPYPDGNVLQKLLKHHEEDAPEVRAVNGTVPPNLAALVRRMMAKDPGKRYQTPQELLSALLEIASGMGLRSTSPEGLIWVSGRTRSSPGKLIWGIWLGAAAALVLCAFWLNWPTDSDQPIVPASAATEIAHATPPVADQPLPDSRLIAESPSANREESAASPVPPSKEIVPSPEPPAKEPDMARTEVAELSSEVIHVARDQDLREVMEQAPSGSIIEITGEHRPLMMHKVDDTAGIRIHGKRLTVRAAPGARPRILLRVDAQAFGVGDWNLFTLTDAQVEFEGIHFEVQVDQVPPSSMAMLALAGSEVSLRRCTFLQTLDSTATDLSRRESEPRVWVVQCDGGIAADGQLLPAKIAARECFFVGGEGGFALNGHAHLDLSDCVLLPFQAPCVIRSEGLAGSAAVDVRLNNVSVFGSGSPIFDVVSARASVVSQGVIYSHETPVQGVLARLDGESRIDWKGRNNLFHGIRQYLVSRAGLESMPLARGLNEWLEMSREVEERDSSEVADSPWLISLAEASSMSVDDPKIADAFRLSRDPEDPTVPLAGARVVVPWGPLYGVEPAYSALHRMKRHAQPNGATGATEPPRLAAANDSRPDRSSKPDNGNARTAEVGMPSSAKLDMKKIMSNMPSSETGAAAVDSAIRPGSDSAATMPADSLIVDPQSAQALPTIAAACARAQDGAVIELRHNGTFRESPIELGNRHLTIRAGAGFRPIIELAVNQLDLRGREPRLFDIRGGSLTLKDLDFVLVVDAGVSVDTWSVVASRTADVHLEGCTVRVEPASGAGSAIVRFLAGDIEDPMTAPTVNTLPVRPQLAMRNCFAINSDHVVRIQPAIRVRVDIENCALDVAHSLLAVAGGMDRSAFGVSNELELRRSTIKMHHGLVNYDATETRAWLPRLEITASDNLLVGDAESPWIRFRSPRSADEMRGLLRWKGTNNGYDGVSAFWQIECMSTGESELLSWDEWVRSPARDEPKAERTPTEFVVTEREAGAGYQTRDDFHLQAAAATGAGVASSVSRGANLDLVPPPPHERQPVQP